MLVPFKVFKAEEPEVVLPLALMPPQLDKAAYLLSKNCSLAAEFLDTGEISFSCCGPGDVDPPLLAMMDAENTADEVQETMNEMIDAAYDAFLELN